MLVADLVGTAVFAVEGAISAMRSNLDLLGVLIIGRRCGVPPVAAALLAGAACLMLRLVSVNYGWQLPKVMGG